LNDFFGILPDVRVNHTFYKHFPPPFQNWTFLKCPFSKTSADSFPTFLRFFKIQKFNKIKSILYMKTLALLIRSHGSIPLTYKPNTQLHEIVKLIDYKKQYNIQNIDSINLSHFGGVCYGDSQIGEFMKEVNKLEYKDTNDKIERTFFNIDEKLKPAVDKIFGISFTPEKTNNIEMIIEKYYTKYDDNSGVFIFSYDNLLPLEITLLQQSLQDLNQQLVKHNKLIKKSDILNNVNSALSSSSKVNLILIDLTCNAYFDENKFPLTEDIVNWINKGLNYYNIRGGSGIKNKKINKSLKSLKSRKTRKNKTKNNIRKKRI